MQLQAPQIAGVRLIRDDLPPQCHQISLVSLTVNAIKPSVAVEHGVRDHREKQDDPNDKHRYGYLRAHVASVSEE